MEDQCTDLDLELVPVASVSMVTLAEAFGAGCCCSSSCSSCE
ncbi:MAG: hypothetical protein ACREKS_16065 [Candidatus Rokuibacteriota bacterium]